MSEKYLTGSEGSNDGISGLLSPNLIDTVSMILFGSNEKEDTKYRVQSCVSVSIGKDELEGESNIMAIHPSEVFFIDYDNDDDIEIIKD